MNHSSSPSPAKYFVVYVILMVLLGATYWFAHLDLGKIGVPVALAIAAMKAILVIFYFMHIRYSNGLIRSAAFVGVFWLGILMTLALSDYVSRDWMPLPGTWPQGNFKTN
ncbi:MAG: cytochrome C oxidase subunit IV family protein [Bdellovibrionia bacterium]